MIARLAIVIAAGLLLASCETASDAMSKAAERACETRWQPPWVWRTHDDDAACEKKRQRAKP